MTRKNSYNYEDLISCANGKMFGTGNARLPYPPMLMFDRITKITEDGGKHDKGYIVAELDIKKIYGFLIVTSKLTRSCPVVLA